MQARGHIAFEIKAGAQPVGPQLPDRPAILVERDENAAIALVDPLHHDLDLGLAFDQPQHFVDLGLGLLDSGARHHVDHDPAVVVVGVGEELAGDDHEHRHRQREGTKRNADHPDPVVAHPRPPAFAHVIPPGGQSAADPADDPVDQHDHKRSGQQAGNQRRERHQPRRSAERAQPLARASNPRAKGGNGQQQMQHQDQWVPAAARRRHDAAPVFLGLAGIEGPVQHLHVAIDPPRRAMFGMPAGMQEIGGDHRRDHPRHRQAEQDRGNDSAAKILEELARNARHQGHRQEDRDNRESGGDHRQADFIRSVDGRLIGGFSHADMPHDILDLHDRIVDQHPRDQPQRQQRQGVEGKAQQIHRPEGRDRRERNGQRRDHRRPPVAQEEEHHHHCEDRPLDHRADRAVVLRFGITDRAEQLGEVDLAAALGLDLLHLVHRAIVDRDVTGPARAGDAESDDLLALELGNRLDLRIGILDRRHVGQLDRPPPGKGNLRLRQVEGIGGIAQHPHRLARARDLGPAAGGVDVDLAERAVDLHRGDPQRLHPRRIERDGNLAVDTAAPVDRRHARHAQQPLGNGIVNEPRQFGHGHVIGADREIGDGIGIGLGLEDLRFENAVGQFAARGVDLVLHLADRTVDVGADSKGDDGLAGAFRRGRADRVDPRDRADRGFDLLGDLLLDLGRRRARLVDHYDHGGEFDVGVVLHLHVGEGQKAGQRQADKQHDRHDRVAN